MKITFLLLLSLSSIAFGAIREIVVTGSLDHGENIAFFQETVPVPFTLRLQFDTEAIDADPDPTHGEYESEGLPVTLDFGSNHFETLNTVIEVYSGKDLAYGFTFGNHDPFTQGGLNFLGEEETKGGGIYALFWNHTADYAPTDELKWIDMFPFYEEGGNVWSSSYTKLDGYTDNEVYTRAQETGTLSFTVVDVVPEPTVFGLLLLCAGLCVRRPMK